MLRMINWTTIFLLRRTIGLILGVVITLLFGRSRMGRQVRMGVNMLRRLIRL